MVETFLKIEPMDLSNTCIKKGALAGKVAVVTGGASNVGLGYARALAWTGAKVVITDINEKSGVEAERVINLENAPDTALFVKCDITVDSDVKNLSKKTFEKFGKVDILINNAMNMRLNGPVMTSTVEEMDSSYAISARGTMMLIHEFVPGMVERGYGVVTYSATQFHYCPPMVGGTIYTAGKAAATSMVMSLANELKGKGVSCFCLTPAGVITMDPERFANRPEGAPTFNMPGFNGFIPPEAGGAAMVYCVLNAEQLNGSGIIISDAFVAMDYPFPNPDTVMKNKSRRLTDQELTMVLCNMGPGFVGFE